jgi:hypothetical protein
MKPRQTERQKKHARSGEAGKLLKGLESMREELGTMGDELISLLKRRAARRRDNGNPSSEGEAR